MDATPHAAPLWQRSATQLASGAAAGDFSITEVIDQFAQRIEQVNPQINAVVYSLLNSARETAQRLDQAGRPHCPGLLYGVPITIKECFYVQGVPATIGLTRHQQSLASHDGDLVRRLREAGAIPLGVTNVPQLMLLHETDNPVYGRTNNPWQLDHGVGGSSGGEAAIIAAGGSPLGLGSDLGGSIRLPAHFCGIHGLKPTNRRIARTGAFANLRGMQGVEYQAGPLARHVEDLELAMRVLTNAPYRWHGGDGACRQFGNCEETDLAQLRIGYWEDDGYFRAAPAIRRVVRQSVAALQASGAQLIALQPPDVPSALRHYFTLVSADGGADFRQLLQGSRKAPEVARLVRLAQTPRWLRPLLAALMRMRGERKLADLFAAAGPRSAQSLWQATAAAQQFVSEIFQTWDDAQLDAVITPPHALPAFLHGAAVDLMPTASHAFLFNLLGVPCGAVACSRVADDELSDRTELSDPVERSARRVELASTGMPIGVQVAARPWREDHVLAIMSRLEKHFRNSDDYPHLARLPL
ncbi:MAG: amidase [Blastopirellula sp. JB062]